MLQGLWLIVKVIGIVALAIIGLLLAIVLAVLFVPLRYRGKISYFGEPQGFLEASWLLHILSLRLQYEKKITGVFKVFGFPVIKRSWLGEQEAGRAETGVPEPAGAGGGALNQTGEAAGTAGKQGGGEAGTAGKQGGGVIETTDKQGGRGSGQQKQADLQKTQGGQLGSLKEASNSRKEARSDKRKGSESNGQNGPGSFFHRMIDKLKGLLDKLKGSTDKLKGLTNKFKEILEKKDWLLDFCTDEANKKTFSIILRECKLLILHIRPRKVKGRFAFGFEDPYTTGQVLMYASPFVGWYYKWFSLEPHFDHEILEGEIAFRGRIRVANLLLNGIRVFCDRNFRKLLRDVRRRK